MKLLIVAPDGFARDTEAAACARALAQNARQAGVSVEELEPEAADRETFLRFVDLSMDRLAPIWSSSRAPIQRRPRF